MSSDRRGGSRRRFLQATGLAAATGLAGCSFSVDDDGIQVDFGDDGGTDAPGDGPTAAQNTPTDTPQRGGTLRLVTSSLTTLDPVKATDTGSVWVIRQLYEGLTRHPRGEASAELLLADDYTVSSDFRTYSFALTDATFHDGAAVTAGDFVYAWERLAASENSRRSYLLLDVLGVDHRTSGGSYVPGSLAVRAPDDRTLEVALAEPNHAALELLADPAFAAVPEGIVGDVDGYAGRVSYAEFAEVGPVGTGPFELDRWRPDSEVRVARFDDYHGTPALLDGVHWAVIDDADAAYNYASNGNADAFALYHDRFDGTALTVERTDGTGRRFGRYTGLGNGATLTYLGVPTNTTWYVGFNMLAVPKPVRTAVAHALNQQDLVERGFDGREMPAVHVTPPAIFPGGDYDGHGAGYPYGADETDIESARQAMEDAGYGPNNRYELQWTQFQSETLSTVASTLRDVLGAAHVDMTVEETPYATMLNRGRTGNLEVYPLGWISAWPRPDDILRLLDPPTTDTDRSDVTSYLNWERAGQRGDADSAARARQAWDRIEANPEPSAAARSAREAAYLDVEEANWDDVGMIPLMHPLDERFATDAVDLPAYGSMGRESLTYETASKRE